jgi:hypothetical protein
MTNGAGGRTDGTKQIGSITIVSALRLPIIGRNDAGYL